VLDIGAGAGALVLRVPASRAGAEIDIRLAGSSWSGRHTAVRERRVDQMVFHAGLFSPLEAGTYEIRWRGDGTESPSLTVVVPPGVVTDLEFDDASGGASSHDARALDEAAGVGCR